MNSNAKCDCLSLPAAISLWRITSGWLDHLEKIDQLTWFTLQKCRVCGQLWQLDLIDRLQTNLAIKVENSYDWIKFDDTPARIHYPIYSRSGLSKETCILQSCNNFALRTLAYCPHHAYFYAGLRE